MKVKAVDNGFRRFDELREAFPDDDDARINAVIILRDTIVAAIPCLIKREAVHYGLTASVSDLGLEVCSNCSRITGLGRDRCCDAPRRVPEPLDPTLVIELMRFGADFAMANLLADASWAKALLKEYGFTEEDDG